jgi:hypothetical protein
MRNLYMKSILSLLTLVMSTLCIYAQRDYTGQWKGTMTTSYTWLEIFEKRIENNGTVPSLDTVVYYADVDLVQSGRSFTGTMKMTKGKEYLYCSIVGAYDTLHDMLKITEIKKINEKTKKETTWCLGTSYLKFSVKGEDEMLSGVNISSEEDMSCGHMDLKIKRAKTVISAEVSAPINLAALNSKRNQNVRLEVMAHSDSITLEVWDHNKVDGDTITIVLNKVVILDHYGLTADKKILRFKLPSGENALVLFAENLGRFPPNTAAMRVIDGTAVTSVVLNSDLTKSEAIKLYAP